MNRCLLPPASPPLSSLLFLQCVKGVCLAPTSRSHTYSRVTLAHSWTVCGNGGSALRPCWGATDWSCTDLPPAPWGFVTHVCGSGLNTFPPSLSFCHFVSLATLTLSPSMHHSGLTLLNLSPSIFLTVMPITGSLRRSALIFFQFYFLWLTVILFMRYCISGYHYC